jgi:hypothetical protein
MIIIEIQQNKRDQPIEINIDSNVIHDTLALLESHPGITAYKLHSSAGTYTVDMLKYSFSGYLFPSGKAVEKFDWK